MSGEAAADPQYVSGSSNRHCTRHHPTEGYSQGMRLQVNGIYPHV